LAILIPDKSYFKIGEVARLLSVEPYVLRYWESEFKCLRLAKTSSQHRIYKRGDIELLALIKRLIHEEGFTVSGARSQINKLTKNGQIAAIKSSMLYTENEKPQPAQVFGTKSELTAAERTALQAKIKASQEQEHKVVSALNSIKLEHEQLKRQSAKLATDNSALERENRMLVAELAQKAQSIQNLMSQSSASSDFQQNLMNENESLNEDLRRLRAQLNETETSLEAAQQSSASLRVDLKAIGEQRESLRERIEEQQNQILILNQTLEFSDTQLNDSNKRIADLTAHYEKAQDAWNHDRQLWEEQRSVFMQSLQKLESENSDLSNGSKSSSTQLEEERQKLRHLQEKYETLQSKYEQLHQKELETQRALVEQQHRTAMMDTKCHGLEQDLREAKRQNMLITAQGYPERIASLQANVHQAAIENKELHHSLQVEKHRQTAVKAAIFEELFALHKAVEL